MSNHSKSIVRNGELTSIERTLVAKAWAATEVAYAPYSKFRVGAAILARNGAGRKKTFIGCNVENASYGGTICAERTAAVKAVSEGFRTFEIVAVVCADAPGGSPCGICRQVLREFGKDAVILNIQNREGDVTRWTMNELLPDSFGPETMESAATATK